MRRTPVAVSVLAAVLLMVATATTAGAATPAVTPNATQWAWVVARHPSTAHYEPAAVDQGNSTGGVDKITRTTAGRYVVRLEGLASSGTARGTAFVTATGNHPRVCAVQWGTSAAAELLYVDCYSPAGTFADSAFAANYLQAYGAVGRFAYAWANNPTSSSYIPATSYNVDTLGGYVTITRSGAGQYAVTFPGLATSGGNVELSPHGSAAVCQVAGWGVAKGTTDEQAGVRCLSLGGSPVDAQFTIAFVDQTALKGQGNRHQAYLYADFPAKSIYNPDAAYRFSTSGLASTIRHISTGSYLVSLPGQPKGGGAQVSEYRSNSGDLGHCQISGIRTAAGPAQIGVACFDFDGTPKNEQFNLAYAR